MKIYVYYILFGVSLFYSCTSKKNEIVREGYKIKYFSEEDIPEVIPLQGKKYGFQELLNPRYIFWEGDYLIVAEKGNDALIHVIDITNNSYLKRIGKNGLGPGEMTMVHRMQHEHASGEFWAYDVEQKRLSKYDVTSDTELAIEQVKQAEALFLAVEMVWTSDSTLMTNRADKEGKYVEFHTNGKVLRTFGKWRDMIDQPDVPINVISSVHQGPLRADVTRQWFVKTGVQRDFVEILNKQSGEIISIRGPEQIIPKFEVDYSAGYPMVSLPRDASSYYFDSCPEREFIYTLYFGKNMELYREGELARRVLVFDYEGNIVREYQLDYDLIAFTVDEENRKIYGITYDEDPNIVEFDFEI